MNAHARMTAPRIWPVLWAASLRDRLQLFRLLWLCLILLAIGGVAAARWADASPSLARQLQVAIATVALAGLWALGYRRRRFPATWLAAEVGLLLLYTHGLQFVAFGVMYAALQYRAMFGSRREATTVAIVYGGTLLMAYVLGPGGISSIGPIVAVQLAAGGFNAYLMYTLSEVLSRDAERAERLRRSEDRFRSLFNNTPWPMWQVDHRTLSILEVNSAAVAHYGYSRDEFLAMSLRDLRTQSDWPSFERVRPALASERRFTHVAQHRRKDGSVLEVEITSEMFDFDGRRARVAVGVDVTEGKNAERALRDSERRFRSVIENLREALLITDNNDDIILTNARVFDVLGYRPEELLGRNATDLLLPETHRNDFRDRLPRRLDGEAELYETQLVHRDGRIVQAEISASPYRDAAGEIIGTLGAVSDVSERKRMEERLRRALRMEVVGQLAGGVAHDFNNLLTVIKCHTELLLADFARQDATRDSIVEIGRSVDRGARLTQQLLAFSRKQLLQPQRIRLAEAVGRCVPALRPLMRSAVALNIRHADVTDLVFTDPLQLELILVALIRNANDAITGRGEITIESSAMEVVSGIQSVANPEMPPGRYMILSVSDTGRGMPADVMTRVFEPFVTTKGPGEGSGLGLASVYGSVRQSGGYVSVESIPGAGTTFRVYLPVVTPLVVVPPAPTELQPA
jgi:two-component system, cell cycle sensor histidine kinase and response regulator CckA